MSKAIKLLVIHAYTGIHAGTGQDANIVDLPIQREKITYFPIIRSSSLKGALRQKAENYAKTLDKNEEREQQNQYINAIFGPSDLEKGEEFAGALSVTDARLLLFPMRSLKGLFGWVTSNFNLKRLKRDLEDCQVSNLNTISFPVIKEDEIIITKDSQLSFQSPKDKDIKLVVLEDLGFKAKLYENMENILTLLNSLVNDNELSNRLGIIKDDIFQKITTFYTEIITRTHLEDETKTVKQGQLWTEELLPAESILVSILVCDDERLDPKKNSEDQKQKPKEGKELLEELKKMIGNKIQIGGNETIGYGICQAQWIDPCTLPQATKNNEEHS